MRRRFFHSRKPLSPGSRVILFLAGLIVSIFLLDLRVRPYIQSISSYQAQIYGTRVINDAIYEELAKDNVRYDNLVTLTQNAQGEITSLQTDMVALGRLRSRVTDAVLQEIDEMGKQDIYLSMGTLSGVQLLSGRGPDLNLKVVPSGYMTSEIENRFDSAGINQTRHQIMLKMDMRVLAIIPGYTVATDIHTEYCLAETVIVGTVPDTFLELADSSDTRQIYDLTRSHTIDTFLKNGDDDFSFSIPGLSRFRVSTYKQRGSLAAVIRVITFELPNPTQLGIPNAVMALSEYTKGMVLVTGPAGSGKSTTLACLVDRINTTKQDHIITLEDPLEYLHRHKESIVSQREISTDTENYLVALRAALRQSPDVILLGEMRDFETIQTAMTAAETGHLVLSSLHTIGAANTISRIIDVFNASQQRQIAVQLSMVLKAVVSQQLVPAKNGTLVPAFEIMVMTPAISNMIRDNKVHQIDGIIYTSAKEDMISMDNSLLTLYRKGIITQETVIQYCTNPEMTRKKL